MGPAGRLWLGVGLACAIVACAPAPSSEPPPATTSVPTDTASAKWVAVDVDEAELQAGDVVADSSGFFLIGSIGQEPLVLESADGVAWATSVLPPTPAGKMAPWTGAASADTLVVMGGGETDQCAHPFAETTWALSTGGEWVVAPFQDLFCAGGGLQIVTDDTSFVVAGNGFGEVPTAWQSSDGLNWVDRSRAAGFGQQPWDVVFDGHDFVEISRGAPVPTISTSADGLDWKNRLGLEGIVEQTSQVGLLVFRDRVRAFVDFGTGGAIGLWDRAADGS